MKNKGPVQAWAKRAALERHVSNLLEEQTTCTISNGYVEDSNCHEWALIDACGDVLQYLADWEEVLDLVADVLGYDPLEGYA